MPKGESGRVVIEVDPDLKRRLYSVLAIENSTLKSWFVEFARRYIAERETPNHYATRQKGKRSPRK